MGLAVFGLYILVAMSITPGRREIADHNARALLAIERWLQIDVELFLNQWLAPHRLLSVIANYEYAYTYIISAAALLAWLYVRFPDDYRRARDSFILLNLFAIACFAVFPVTPPRLLPDLGYVDTVAQGATFGSWGTPLVSSANQYAAMPSLHLAWALWVSVVLARQARGISIQIVNAVHVGVTVYVIAATANHFLVDAIAAIPFVWASVALVERRSGRAPLMSSADAFFLSVETRAAPQHVGGMVVLRPSGQGTPSLADLRLLVRDQLPDLPRFRQRPERSAAWHRWRWADVDPADIDWEWHISERAATGTEPGSASAVLSRTVAELAMEPMPRDRPMWRIVLVREIGPGQTGLLFFVHHCVADGVGTVVHSLNLLRPRLELPVSDRPAPGWLTTTAGTVKGLAQLATDGRPVAKLPTGTGLREFAAVVFGLDTARSVAHARHMHVTDLLLGVVATAVSRSHPSFAASVGNRLRVSVPIMLREPGSTPEGNVTAASMIDLPVGTMQLEDRLRAIALRGARLRTPTRALASRFVMAKVLGVFPAPAQRWFARTVYGPAFLQGIVSNMPGPTAQMSLLDVPFESVFPILPLAPDAPLALGALSWTGRLGIGLAVDPKFLRAEILAAAMQDVFDELRGVAVTEEHERAGK